MNGGATAERRLDMEDAPESCFVVAQNTGKPLRDCVEAALRRYFSDLNGDRPGDLYDMVLKQVEQPLFKTVMEYTRGNQSRAAEILGLNRSTLRKKLRQYGLNR